MEPIEVTFRFDPQGKIYPLGFTWKGHRYVILSVGRRWEAANDSHILVMTANERVFELVYSQNEAHWFLNFRNSPQNLV